MRRKNHECKRIMNSNLIAFRYFTGNSCSCRKYISCSHAHILVK